MQKVGGVPEKGAIIQAIRIISFPVFSWQTRGEQRLKKIHEMWLRLKWGDSCMLLSCLRFCLGIVLTFCRFLFVNRLKTRRIFSRMTVCSPLPFIQTLSNRRFLSLFIALSLSFSPLFLSLPPSLFSVALVHLLFFVSVALCRRAWADWWFAYLQRWRSVKHQSACRR